MSYCRFGLTTFVILLVALSACRKPETDEVPAASQAQTQAPSPAPTPAPTNEPEPAKPTQEPAKSATENDVQVIHATTKAGETDIQVKAPEGWQVVQPPNAPDPHNGRFTLNEALKGLKGKGGLVATIQTSMGNFYCDLYEDKTPITVANFVGLARGLRKFWSAKERAWVGRPYYDGLGFHRLIPGFMIQGGDLAGDGSGRAWFTIPDELHASLKHDRAGQLCMANRGPNTNEAQFFITETAAPHLDGSYSIFGQCMPPELAYRIARVPQSGPPNNRPLTPVTMEHVIIARVEGGAASALSHAPKTTPAPLPKNEVPGVAPPGRALHTEQK